MARRVRWVVVGVVAAFALLGHGPIPVSAPAAAVAPCPTDAEPVPLESAAQVQELIIGTWIRCEGPPIPGSPVADVGLDVNDGGRWQRLYRAEDGSIVRASGAAQEGSTAVIDLTDINGPGSYQVDFGVLAGGTHVEIVTFTSSPITMRFEISGSTYVLDPSVAPIDGTVPGLDTGCGLLDDPISPTSGAQATELIVGVWIRCDGAGGPDGQVGLELGVDGRFFRVYEASDGALVRADGIGQEGVWSLTGDGTGEYQFDLRLVGGGMIPVSPVFFASPASAMSLPAGGAFFPAGGYLRWTGDPPRSGTPPGPEPSCGHFRRPVELTSTDQAVERLIGAWTLCDPDSVLGAAAPGEVGIEFVADGRFHLLIRQSDGAVVEGSGAGHLGTWAAVAGAEPDVVQIDLQVAGGLLHSFNPVYFADPDAVYLQTGLSGTRYVRGVPSSVDGAITTPTIPATGASPGRWPLVAISTAALGATLAILASRRRTGLITADRSDRTMGSRS